MHMISISVPFFAYVELYLGIYDFDRRCIRSDSGKDGGRDQCGAGFCGGCGIPVYHNDRRDGIVGRVDGNCAEVRVDC